MNKYIALTLLLLAVVSPWLRAEDSSTTLPNYFVSPVTTDLQRSLVRKGTTIYAEVNGDALVKDGKIDLAPLENSSFLSEIKTSWNEDASLCIVCKFQFSATIVESSLQKQLASALEKYCSQAGISQVSTVNTMTSSSWNEQWANVSISDDSLDAQEPLVEDELVQAYPIRTRLSKYLMGDGDCFVRILPSIDGRMTNELPSDLKLSITNAVQALDVQNKHKLLFDVSSTAAGEKLVEQLFNQKQPPVRPKLELLIKDYQAELAAYKQSPGLTLAKELGFESIGYGHSPNGGAPEKLIGKPSPNFELEALGGGQLELHQFTKGRPAIITFWGLACGPCRVEAPHLSQLQQKFGRDKLSIVAVNCYNDDKADVQKYVDAENLTHPIVLQGESIARNDYHVTAHPTTFWIDSNGVVVDYEVGFESAKRLESKIQKLLDATP